jgi:hypothetical protein
MADLLAAGITAAPLEMTTLCAGYERGEWRKSDFVNHLFDYLVEFALKWSSSRT